PHGWWGDVVALPIVIVQAPNVGSTLAIASAANWSASCVLTGGQCPQMGTDASGHATHPPLTPQAPSSRVVLTSDASGPARCTTSLPAAALSASGGKAIVKYIRGVRSVDAGHGGNLRTRTSVMGDVVRSSPIYVGRPVSSYADQWSNLLHPGKTPA